MTNKPAKPHMLLLPVIATAMAIILAIAALALDLLFRGPVAAVALGGSIPATGSKALEVLTTSTTSYMTSAFAVLAAVGFFAKGTLGKDFELTKGELITLSMAAALALASIFFGHVATTSVLDMLANDFLNFHATNVRWAMRLEYLALLLSVFILAVAVLTACFRVAREKK